MKIIAVIPARYDSTRFPGKMLADILGKPMIQHVYEAVSKSKLIERIIVATDDKRIFDAVEKFGGEAAMTSKKHESGTDRICEVIKKINCDIVVNVQGDEPGIEAKNIDRAIKALQKEKGVNISTLAVKIVDTDAMNDENKVKVVFDNKNFALYFSRACIPYSMNKSNIVTHDDFYKHIGLYVYRRNFLMNIKKLKSSKLEQHEMLEQLRFLDNGEKIKVAIADSDAPSVDTPIDLQNFIIFKEYQSLETT